jgi:hypothetical protein
MHSLRDTLECAQKTRSAVGHFNVSDLILLKAVFTAAIEPKVPVLLGVSEGERAFIGDRQIAALVRSLREEFDFPIFLNADHTHSLIGAIEAAKAGFDTVVFDLSTLPFEQNARQTKEAVEALKAINPAILVEGEIGDIGSGSEIHADTSHPARGLTTPEEAHRFVDAGTLIGSSNIQFRVVHGSLGMRHSANLAAVVVAFPCKQVNSFEFCPDQDRRNSLNRPRPTIYRKSHQNPIEINDCGAACGEGANRTYVNLARWKRLISPCQASEQDRGAGAVSNQP